jgi:hypothetical protein
MLEISRYCGSNDVEDISARLPAETHYIEVVLARVRASTFIVDQTSFYSVGADVSSECKSEDVLTFGK